MQNINAFVGRLTREPNLRYTKGGLAVATFTLAVDRPGTFGEKKKTDYPDFIIWRKSAENLATLCQKGTQISVSGVLTTRLYTDEETGKTTKYTEVVVNDWQILKDGRPKDKGHIPLNDVESAGKGAMSPGGTQEEQPPALTDEDDYGRHISDEDLPF